MSSHMRHFVHIIFVEAVFSFSSHYKWKMCFIRLCQNLAVHVFQLLASQALHHYWRGPCYYFWQAFTSSLAIINVHKLEPFLCIIATYNEVELSSTALSLSRISNWFLSLTFGGNVKGCTAEPCNRSFPFREGFIGN